MTDSFSVPPPPEFGLVLEAPPPRGMLSRTATPMPVRRSRRRRWLVAAGAFGLLAGVAGFVLGNLGDDDARAPVAAGPSAAPSGTLAASAPAPGPAQAAADPMPAPVAVAAPPPAPVPTSDTATATPAGPCPEGMVHVAGGKLFVGTDRDVPVLASARPAHQVEVGPYCIDAHEVTVAAYRECSDLGECKRAHRTSEWPGQDEASRGVYDELCNESYEDRGDHPVNCVTWAQAQHYCEHRGGRLPTEHEWELAARGSDGRVYPWGDEPPDPTRMNGCGAECRTWRAAHGLEDTPVLYEASDAYFGTSPVGRFAAGRTQWGLDDMAGNVFEWTADRYQPYPGAPEAAQLDDEAVEGRRVIRGGAFNSTLPDHADPALRFPQDETAHTHGIGFRCAAAVRP